MLENKNAVIYGAGGAVGGVVARAFASEGAKVFLAGRTLAPIDAVAREISAAGGVAETAQVDALDEQAVEKHIGEVAKKAGGVDVSFNLIGIGDEWLEGGFFLVQNVDLDHGGQRIKGIEIIGHEKGFGATEPSKDLTSRFFDNAGCPAEDGDAEAERVTSDRRATGASHRRERPSTEYPARSRLATGPWGRQPFPWSGSPDNPSR